MAAKPPPSKPEREDHLGKDEVARGRMAPHAADPPSLAQPALRRHSPEVGAVCGKAARTVLCGGRSAMSVPTATARLRAVRTLSNELTVRMLRFAHPTNWRPVSIQRGPNS